MRATGRGLGAGRLAPVGSAPTGSPRPASGHSLGQPPRAFAATKPASSTWPTALPGPWSTEVNVAPVGYLGRCNPPVPRLPRPHDQEARNHGPERVVGPRVRQGGRHLWAQCHTRATGRGLGARRLAPVGPAPTGSPRPSGRHLWVLPPTGSPRPSGRHLWVLPPTGSRRPASGHSLGQPPTGIRCHQAGELHLANRSPRTLVHGGKCGTGRLHGQR